MKKLYLAARYKRREEMEQYANRLKMFGYGITATWVYGGEEGKPRDYIALLDLEDIDRADAVVSFTELWDTPVVRGGRHVEFGYGLAKGKEMIVIGNRENVFHWHPNVKVFETLDQWIEADKPTVFLEDEPRDV